MVKIKMENVNPKNRKAADCVIRAITKASGKDYWRVAEDLFAMQKKTGYMLNEKKCYEKVLEQYGFVKRSQPRKCDNTKYLAGEINQVCDKVAVISVANHLTCYDGECIVDTWDCRYKTIGNYWVKYEKDSR